MRACSFERKIGQQRRGASTSSMLQRSVSFGHKSRRSSGSGEGGQTGPLQLVPSPEGHISHEGFLRKRASLKYQKRWFFIKARTLCYYDPARPGEKAHAIVCGELSSVTIKSVERLELSMWTDQRQYDFRCDAKQDLTAWKDACEKAIAKHWYA